MRSQAAATTSGLTAEIRNREAQVARLRSLESSGRAQAARLEADLAAIRNSTSWRLTKPLRQALLRSSRALRLVRSALRFARWSVILRLPQEARAWHRARRDAPYVAKSVLFDKAWYVAQNPDVVGRGGVDPCWHYVRHGGREGRDPHPLFDSSWYLEENPDVAASGVNPLVHYLARGAIEGRDPHPLFGTEAYLRANPDVAAAGMNPLVHYVLHGGHEGRPVGEEIGTSVVDEL